MVSTPAGPGSLFYKIEAEPEDTCIYKRLKLDYTYGLNQIYTEEEIEQAKHSHHRLTENTAASSSALSGMSSVHSQIDKVIELGEQYSRIRYQPTIIHFMLLA